MRRVSIIAAILGLLIVADGIFQQVTQYKSGETQQLLQTNVTLTDGVTLIVSGAIVLVVSIIAFALAGRSAQSSSAQSSKATVAPETRAPAKN